MAWKIYRNPSDTPGPSGDTLAEDSQDAPVQGARPDPVAQLESELTAARLEASQWQDRFLRKAAEFDNFRKRSEKEKLDLSRTAKSAVLVEILPILDSCERALQSFDRVTADGPELVRYREGVELLYRQLNDLLSLQGVTAMEVVGKPFDPHLHEALGREETADHEENTIIDELRRGYLFQDRLLRPAQVRVTSRPQPKDESDT